ncbi:MAG: HlyD family efflux transporter periplasmic adaptor subunit [Hyphomicrobium sp.]
MSVKIRRERPDQRRHHRVTAPLLVSVGGHAMRAADWSLGGLRVDGYPGPLPSVGDELLVQLTLPFQGFDVTFNAKSEVVRLVEASASFAVRFTELGERERELMQHFIEELVRGSMVDVEDTIQRIDVPVTPASLEPDKPRIPAIAVPMRRLPVKTMVMTGLYLVVGLAVFGYAGLLGYSNFFRMEIQTAVIAAPVEIVTAQSDGEVLWTEVKPGDTIRSGEVIVKLIDSQLEREIDLAEIAVQERKAKLAYLKQRHVEELDRIRGYGTVEMKNLKQTEIELRAFEAQLAVAEQNYGRLRGLLDKGYATASKFEDAERSVIMLRKEVDVRRVELASRLDLADQNLGKRMYSGNETIGSADIVGKSAELEAEVRLADHDIVLAQQRLISYVDQRTRAAVRSPFDGMVLELPRPDRGTVRRGDTLAVIEQRRNRHIAAWLNQDEVMKVGLGDEALLYVPALGETLQGRVTSIDRTSGFIREQDQRQNPGYAWRGPTDRSAKVTIAFVDPAKVADHDRYRSGLPVVVVFERRSTNSLTSSISKKLDMNL